MFFTAEPSGLDMTENDSQLCSSQPSTNSTKSRKLRQVLQKKQLDVLLQTYSSYIDEPVDPETAAANDYFSITRKKSIEGTPRTASNSQKPQNGEVSRSRMRKSKSLISTEDEYVSTHEYTTSSQDESHHNDPSETDDESADAIKGKHAKDRKNKKKVPTNKRKKKVDFSARLLKAKEVVQAFSTRAAQKHLEIAADFQTVTKEIRHHLKSGANVVCEDLADQFDGAIENIFVGDFFDHRDDDGILQAAFSQLRQTEQEPESRISRDTPTTDDRDFEPLSHEETIEVMHQQITEILRPVAAMTVSLQEDLECFHVPEAGEEEEMREMKEPS
jgi:hypothetical protein